MYREIVIVTGEGFIGDTLMVTGEGEGEGMNGKGVMVSGQGVIKPG